jgi:hypothetical protein
MRAMRRPALVLVLGLLAAPAGTASAQAPADCPAPAIDGFRMPTRDPLRTGSAETITVAVRGASRVAIDWPDGTASSAPVRGDEARLRHVFRRTGRYRLVATATAACGASSAAALTVRVHAPCAQARDASVLAEDCDAARGSLALAQGGLATVATWLTAPCRDVLYPPALVPPQPVARAAVCVAPPGPPPVAGRLPVRTGRVLFLRLGVPAARVSVALGNRRRAATPYVRAGALGAGRRLFRIRVGRVVRSTRLWIRVRLPAGSTQRFVAGVRATQAS